MRLSTSSLILAIPIAIALAEPFPTQQILLAGPHRPAQHEAILFDALAFPTRENRSETSLFSQFFLFDPYYAHFALPTIRNIIKREAGLVGLSRDGIIEERLRLFLANGVSHTPLAINVTGCSTVAKSPKAFDGRTVFVSDMGLCDLGEDMSATLLGDSCGPELPVTGTVYLASDGGYGIISDIDDTVKQSFVLDKRRLIQTTFTEEPKPVPNMPTLYASLSNSLNNPLFVYISGSPFQLYPFLKSFIDDVYSLSKGPIFTRELQFSLTKPAQMLGFLGQDSIQQHKISMIRNLVTYYPNKQWLAIGDSGEHDPEIYGEMFREYPDSIACIWIRRLEGAKNSPERFLRAFQGIPHDRYKIFEDAELPSMSSIDIRRGCN